MGEINRSAEFKRKTRETEIFAELNLDGNGIHQIDTEITFLSHMLTLFAVHSLCDLKLAARGDMQVDDHHTVEDIGICLGETIKLALGDKKGMTRYGEATIPMDEALARVVIDVSNRPYLVYNVVIPVEKLGVLTTENIQEFFRALANHAGITIHIDMLRGENSHHIIEAVFKAFARAFKAAVTIEPNIDGVWSSKGKL